MDRNRISGNLWGNAVQARDIHGDVTFIVRHRWWLTALLVVIGIAASTTAVYWITRPGEVGTAKAGPPPPRLVSKVSYESCGLQHHEGDPKAADVGRIKKGEDPTLTHVQSSLLTLDIYAQNPSPQEVILTDLRVEVHKKTSPPTTGYLADTSPCGGPVEPRYLLVDLKPVTPTVVPDPGEQGEEPVKFPYQVKQGDPELFRLHFAELTDYVEFLVVLDVIVEGREYQIPLDNEGRYFKVTGPSDLPRYQAQGDRLVPSG
ncbi:hypothetical protein Lesp02_81380 [Lentzea sp. NBRC 105346]|uniref:hypothetical protein n=1 Tax=Lentzea sp. NBRC 105346 TaxID=3032205 RepID=UPI0024A1906B|nr:hypothetical protein [Lentzea sp. NBRC 105346]GLZ35951.1 hypothetical protein Lesp02_81380 [Lentzea sp. NBRC 105346]